MRYRVKSDLLDELKGFYRKNGVIPKTSDFCSSKGVTDSSFFYNHFSSWFEALYQADLITKQQRDNHLSERTPRLKWEFNKETCSRIVKLFVENNCNTIKEYNVQAKLNRLPSSHALQDRLNIYSWKKVVVKINELSSPDLQIKLNIKSHTKKSIIAEYNGSPDFSGD